MPVLLHSGLSAYCTELAAIEGKFADDSNRIGLHPAELRSSRCSIGPPHSGHLSAPNSKPSAATGKHPGAEATIFAKAD